MLEEINLTDYREVLKEFKKSDYESGKVNLHIHTIHSDGLAGAEDIVRQAKLKGYKKIAISDHNTVNAYLKTNILKDDIVIPAVEFDVWCDYVFLHLLAYGIDVNNPELKKYYAITKQGTESDIVRIFARRNIEMLIKTIHYAGGVAILAHPACCWALNMNNLLKKLISYGLDGLEVYYPYKRHRAIIKFRTAKQIEDLADKYHLIKTGGTDLHGMYL